MTSTPAAGLGLELDRDLDLARRDPKLANRLYHDALAARYDAKWAISFDERCVRYVRERAERMLPRRRYGRVLEVGVGTGFFILNLWQAGYVEEAHACDLSTGMLAACAESAHRIGCDVSLRAADAERLPYPDGRFDLVVGHAVLHHLPAPDVGLAEMFRVLARGGAVLLAGEPSRAGDSMARAVGRATSASLRRLARVAPRLRRSEPDGASPSDRVLRALEWHVDLHTFEPAVVAEAARRAGFRPVRVETEELASSVVGWAVRTVEAEAPEGLLGERWGRFAYRTYLALSALDRAVLYPILPRRLFYNVLLYGEKPDGPGP